MTHASKHGHGERHGRKLARSVLARSGYKAGGHLKSDKKLIGEAIHEHESHMHKGEKKTAIKLKEGGYAHGGSPMARGDRKPRHGKSKGHTTVVVNAGGQGQPVPVPVPKPIPVPVGAASPMGAGPGGPPMPPKPMPGGMAAGAPPGIMKRGGRAKHKKGGKIKGYPIDDGAGGGEGRKEKAKAYGATV